ncbi:MAG: preprotein translocase subunit SecG [Pseudomonadota bacterium]
MTTVLLVVHIMLVLALIVLVLLQRSEGGALGIGGGGGGGGLMSARGAANALTKSTTVLAAGFFATSIALGVVANRDNRTEDVLRQVEGAAQSGVPTENGDAGTGAAPDAGSLLDDLNQMGGGTTQDGQVPTGN